MDANHQLHSQTLPKLRPLEVHPVQHRGQPYLLLADPEQLSPQQLLVPQPLAAVLAFCDGQRDAAAMAMAFNRRYHFALSTQDVLELLAALDEALMLDNPRADAARQAALDAFRSAPARESALAGHAYPAQRHALWQELQDLLEEHAAADPAPVDWSRPVGLLSPHIDYARGGPVYAQIWQRAAQAVKEAELVVMIGTDHHGDDLFTLTRQHYATPYGLLPTDQAVVERLAAFLGPAAFAGELRHRREHSLELVAVWLHHLRGGEPVPVVPMLVGSLRPEWTNGRLPAEHPAVTHVLATLQALSRERRVLIVASGDLAHVGPAFGGAPLDGQARHQLAVDDTKLRQAMQAGDAVSFLQEIREVQNSNNVCGVTPIYLTLRALGSGMAGEESGYAVCPADEEGTSAVTISGVLWRPAGDA